MGKKSNLTYPISPSTSPYSSATRERSIWPTISPIGANTVEYISVFAINWLGTGFCVASHTVLRKLASSSSLEVANRKEKGGWLTAASRALRNGRRGTT